MVTYKDYIVVLKGLAAKLNKSDDGFHLGGDVENLITELEAIEE